MKFAPVALLIILTCGFSYKLGYNAGKKAEQEKYRIAEKQFADKANAWSESFRELKAEADNFSAGCEKNGRTTKADAQSYGDYRAKLATKNCAAK